MKPVTTLPDIEILSNSERLPAYMLEAVDTITVIQKISMPSLCEIAFSANENLISGSDTLLPGSEITIRIEGDALPLFAGTITAVEHNYGSDGIIQSRIRGYDPLYILCKNQKVLTYSYASLTDIAREMTSSYNFKIETKSKVPTWERLIQYNETDIDFLSRIAHMSGHCFFFRNDCLCFAKPEATEASCFLSLGENLMECNIKANSAHSLKSVYTSGWDPFKGEIHESSVSDSKSGCSVDFTFSDSIKNYAGERKLVDIGIRNSEEAEIVSQGEMDRSKSREISVHGIAEGNSLLYPGAGISIDRVAREFCGTYYLTEVTHTINSRYGFISEFNTLLPENIISDKGPVTTFGIVTDINDPEKLGRMKVSLETYTENETDWMNVVLPSSGKEKGIVMLPETGDKVLVLFMNNNPARGVILGGISTASDSSHKWGIEDGKVKQFSFISPSGQKLILDDKNEILKIENLEGSSIELGPGSLSIHSKTDLIIEAPGKTITICGKKIDFKKG